MNNFDKTNKYILDSVITITKGVDHNRLEISDRILLMLKTQYNAGFQNR